MSLRVSALPPASSMPPSAGAASIADTASGPVLAAGSRLTDHLTARLGTWPPSSPLEIVVWPGRSRPGWDGGTWPALGVEGPLGTVVSLVPAAFPDPRVLDPAAVAAALRSPHRAETLPAALGRPHLRFGEAVLRWTERPASLPEIGEWVMASDPRLPDWLRPFGGEALVAWDAGRRLTAGVGLKRHDRFAHELAVGTEPDHRGSGLARALVAQAARRLLREGIVPLYLHETDNAASARVAEAAGFPDGGWRTFWLSSPDEVP